MSDDFLDGQGRNPELTRWHDIVTEKPNKCDICGSSENVMVACSTAGAVSHVYCHECMKSNREVWGTLVGGLMGLTKDEVSESFNPIIKATCEFYGRTEEELWEEVSQAEEEYFEAMSYE
jgi:hypothetical protein